MAYTNITNVEAFLRTSITSSTTPDLDTVESWIIDADKEVERLTGRKWKVTTNTEYFDLNNETNKFLVSKYPLVSVTSISYNDYTNSDPVFNPNWVAFDNYRTVGDFIETDKYVSGKNKVKVVYTYGYTTVPPEIEYLATLLIVKKIMLSDDSANNSTDSLSIGSISLTQNVGTSRLLNIDTNIRNILKNLGTRKTILR